MPTTPYQTSFSNPYPEPPRNLVPGRPPVDPHSSAPPRPSTDYNQYNPYNEYGQQQPYSPRFSPIRPSIPPENQALLHPQHSNVPRRPAPLDLRSTTPTHREDTRVASISILKTPLSAVFKKRPKEHPFSRNFEAPHWWYIGLHATLCLISYPIILLFILVAKDRSLFWTRFIVSAGCGLTGFMLGLSLLRMGKSFLEASTWATIIHQSTVTNAPGVRLKDLAAATEDPYSAYAGTKLLWDRMMYTGTSRKHRNSYDPRPWSLFIAFFLLLVAVSASLPFIFGRLVDINANIGSQREKYYETTVYADLSDKDIDMARSLQPSFENYALTWTMAPFSTHGGLPPVLTFGWQNSNVFFSETVLSQLLPNGSGFGTFDVSTTNPSLKNSMNTTIFNITNITAIETGSLIRYPRWGIRIHCAKVSNPDHIIPRVESTNFTYLLTSKDLLRSLFTHFEMDYPEDVYFFNASVVMQGNHTLPESVNPDDLALGGHFYDNGVAHSMRSSPLTMGAEGYGWISVEQVLVRLNSSFTPEGKFLRLSGMSEPDENGTATYVGYDAAVCLELFEPWVLETYNSSLGFLTTQRIVDKLPWLEGMNAAEINIGATIIDPAVSRKLNSTRLTPVYIAAHQNSINQILKDNGRDAFYVPNPTIVSYTSGQGPLGYTELSPEFFAQSRGLADANNILPYLAGTGPMVARVYPDRVVSSASVRNIEMILALAGVLILGLIAGLFVPKLPLNVPRRGFQLYTWMAAFRADELVGENEGVAIPRNMDLMEMQERLGELKFRYVRPSQP